MTERERIEDLLRTEHDDYDEWDTFSQLSATTTVWLYERGVDLELFKLPTKQQMMACMLDIMPEELSSVAGRA